MTTQARLANLSFSVKFAIPSCMAVMLVIFIGVLANGAIDSLSHSMQDVVENKFNASTVLGESIERLRAADSNVYQMQTHQAAGIKQDIAAETKKITDILLQVKNRLEKFKTMSDSADDKKKIDGVLASLSTYKDAVDFVGSMLELDFKATVNLITPLAKSYDVMIEDLSGISQKFLAESQQQSQASIASATERKHMLLLLGSVALVVMLLLTFWIVSVTVRSINLVAQTTKQLADGDTDVDIAGLVRRDELGQIVQALEVFRDNTQQVNALRIEQEAAEKRSSEERKAMRIKMADTFEASVKAVVQAVSQSATQMQNSARGMSSNAEEMQMRSKTVASASETASMNVQTVASAAEELSSSINEIGRQVSESARVTTQAVAEMRQTDVYVQSLAVAAQKIGDVVKLINDIAGQTNLLALNATIEAARAGEAGKGFAVVASEVKNLAMQTTKATEDIGTQINAIQSATTNAVQAIGGISTTIGRVNDIATSIASAVQEQGAATKEIAHSVQEASTGTTEVSSNISSVTAAAEVTGKASGSVLIAAGELTKQAASLQSEVDKFLTTIRSA